VQPTAVGLAVCYGLQCATDESYFCVFDSKTGKELWVTNINAAFSAPITFQGKDGKHYVAITARVGGFLGDQSHSDSWIASALQ
jgi:glucose dehydrogenase